MCNPCAVTECEKKTRCLLVANECTAGLPKTVAAYVMIHLFLVELVPEGASALARA